LPDAESNEIVLKTIKNLVSDGSFQRTPSRGAFLTAVTFSKSV